MATKEANCGIKCPYCGGKQNCLAKTNGWSCTRFHGHSGDHVACSFTHAKHRWPQQEQPTEVVTVEEATIRIKAELDRMEPEDVREMFKILIIAVEEKAYQQGIKAEHKRLIEDSEALGELINQADLQAIATRLPLDTEFVGMIKVK